MATYTFDSAGEAVTSSIELESSMVKGSLTMPLANRVDQCAEREAEEIEEEESCSGCQPDPNAIIPIWTEMDHGVCFFNGKVCEYQTVIATEYTSTGGSELEARMTASISGAAEKLLEFYDKAEEFDLMWAQGGGGPTNDTLEYLRENISPLKWHMPIEAHLPMKVLHGIDADIFDGIPVANISTGSAAVISSGSVSIKAEEFPHMIRRVSRLLRIYSDYSKFWMLQDVEGPAKTEPVDLREESENIKLFRTELKKFIEDNGYYLPHAIRLGGVQEVEEIEMGFEEGFVLSYVRVNGRGCQQVDLKKRWSQFTETEPVNLSRTMAYIAKLVEMDQDARAREPKDWREFVEQYTYPPVEYAVYEEDRSQEEELGVLGCAASKVADTAANIAQQGLMSAVEIFSGELRNRVCAELEGQVIEEDRFLKDQEVIRKIAHTQALIEHVYNDKVMGQINELGSAYGERITNLDELFELTLSPLGKCGFAAMFQQAMGCFMDGLGFDKVVEKLVKAAVKAMNEEVIGRLIGFLPEDVQEQIKASAFQTVDPAQMAQFLADNADKQSEQIVEYNNRIADNNNVIFDYGIRRAELVADMTSGETYDSSKSFDGNLYGSLDEELQAIDQAVGSLEEQNETLQNSIETTQNSIESVQQAISDIEEFGSSEAIAGSAASWTAILNEGNYSGNVFDVVVDAATADVQAVEGADQEAVAAALEAYEQGQESYEQNKITEQELSDLQQTYETLLSEYESESDFEVNINDAVFGARVIIYDPDTELTSYGETEEAAIALNGSPTGYIVDSSGTKRYYRQVDGDGDYIYNHYYNPSSEFRIAEIVRGQLGTWGNSEFLGDEDDPTSKVNSGEGYFFEEDTGPFQAIVAELGSFPEEEGLVFANLINSGDPIIETETHVQGPIMLLDSIDREALALESTAHAPTSYQFDSGGLGTGQATVDFSNFDQSGTQMQIVFAPVPQGSSPLEAFDIISNVLSQSVVGQYMTTSTIEAAGVTTWRIELSIPGATPSVYVDEYGQTAGLMLDLGLQQIEELEALNAEYEIAESLSSDEDSAVTAEILAELQEQIDQVEEQLERTRAVDSLFASSIESSGTGGAASIEGFPDPFGVGVTFDGEAMLDAILDAYKNAIIEYFEGAYEELMEQIEKLPGYELVQRVMQWLDCGSQPPLFSPPLDSWFKEQDLNPCRELEPIVWPEMRELNFVFPDLIKIIFEAAKATLRRLLLQALTGIIKKLLQFLEFNLCDAMKKLGNMTADMMQNGFDAFTDELKSILGCGDELTDEELEDAVADIMESAGFAAASVSSNTTEEGTVMSRWLSSVQSVITEEEFQACLNGRASDTTLRSLAEVTRIRAPELAETGLATKSGIRKFFNGVGSLVNLPLFNKRFEQAKYLNQEYDSENERFLLSAFDQPLNSAYCEEDGFEEFKKVRRSLLGDKDPEMTEEQIQQQIDQYEENLDELMEEFADAVADQDQMLANLIPPLFSESNTCPGADGQGLLPAETPMESAAMKKLAKDVFGAIQSSYYEDLLGRRGFFNMVLANANGTSLRTHYNLWNTFGWILPIPGEGLPETVATYLKMELMNKDHFEFSPVSAETALSQRNEREPDCVLSYSDEGAAQQQGYSFDVKYWNYLFEDNGDISTEDKYRIQVVDSPTVPPDMQEYLIEQATLQGRPAPTFDEDNGMTLIDEVGTASISEDVEEVLESLSGFDLSAGYSRQAEAFAALFCESWIDFFGDNASAYIRSTVREHARKNIFSAINERFLEMMAMEISYPEVPHDKTYEAGSGKASEMPAYYYGDKEPDSELWGGIFFSSPNYGRIDKNADGDGLISLKTKDESRKNAKDQGAYYGLISGSLASARGLSSIAGMFIPPWHGCEPGYPDPVNWEEIGNIAAGVGSDDERLGDNPACQREPPFSRIHTKVSRGMIQASIKSYIRLQLVEMLLKGLGPFSTFKIKSSGVSEHILKTYACSKIDKALQEDSPLIISPGSAFQRIIGNEEDALNYYYEFVEQTVQMVLDQVQSGGISTEQFPSAVQSSIKNIQKEVKEWVEPVPFGLDQTDPRVAALITICLTAPAYASYIPIIGAPIKAFLRERKRTWRSTIIRNLEDSKTIMRHIIGEELDEVLNSFYELIGEPAQDDMNKLIYNIYNNNWIPTIDVPGNLSLTSEDGSVEVPDGRFGNFLFNQESQFSGNQIAGERGSETTVTPDRFGKGWFVLEKYIRVIEKYDEDDLYETSGYYQSGARTDLDAYLSEQVQFALDSFESVDALAEAYGNYIGKTVTIEVSDGDQYQIFVDGELFETQEADALSLIGFAPYERDPRLYGVINVNTWQEFLASQTDLADQTIDSLFEAWHWGLRLSYVAPMETMEDWDKQPADIYEPILNNETGNLSRATAGLTTVNAGRESACLREKAYGVPEDPTYVPDGETETSPESPVPSETKSENGRVSQSSEDLIYTTGKNYVIPLIAVEQKVKSSLKMSEFSAEDYDQWCLWNELVKTPHHKMLFDYCFPTKRLLNLATIYNIHGFLPSVGIRDGEWTKGLGGPGGQFGYRLWDQEMFDETRRLTKKIFRANYNIRDESYEDEEDSEDGGGGGIGRTRERLQFTNKGRDWSPWWLRKRSLTWGRSAKGDFCGESGDYNDSEEDE